MYKKLITVYKLKKKLITKIVQKYGNKAKARVRKNAANLKKSKTNVIKKVADSGKVPSLFSSKDMPAKK